jgi:hypothetical protein
MPFAFLLWAMLAQRPQVEPALLPAYMAAVKAWGMPAPLASVRYCWEEECADSPGGGEFDYITRTIIIWPDFPLPRPDGLVLVLLHEYGHALGLHHVDREDRISIMNEGWRLPYGEHPSVEDIAAARQALGYEK